MKEAEVAVEETPLRVKWTKTTITFEGEVMKGKSD